MKSRDPANHPSVHEEWASKGLSPSSFCFLQGEKKEREEPLACFETKMVELEAHEGKELALAKLAMRREQAENSTKYVRG